MKKNTYNSLCRNELSGTVPKIAEEYFDYMGRNYPVMCLSDEFYFFPRAKQGAKFLNTLDSLDEKKIRQDVAYIKNLRSCLENINLQDIDLEMQIDIVTLKQSMSTYLREFEQIKIWQIDPTIYLKVLLLGIDQILNNFSFLKQDFDDNLRSRITQIPRLLNEAKKNLKGVPLVYLEVAIEMVEASIRYFKAATFVQKNEAALHSLEDFKKFLLKLPIRKFLIKDKRFLEDILKDSFSYNRSLKEIFDIASEEYAQSLKALTQVAKKIKPREKWQKILFAYRIDVKDDHELLELYSNEIKNIKRFCQERDLVTIPQTQNIKVRLTPRFMQPVRASASYSSPVTTDRRESAFFYITADSIKNNNSTISKFFSDIHNEYIFVTAHESYPGHHLLDSIRRSLKNSIRRQIESALFYEGWASYAESLIMELGYIENPLQRLVGLKRQAWRAVRAMLDVGVRINKFGLEDAARMLQDLGYEAKIVKSMLRHYVLTPGYQLCYTIGKFEIERLKKMFCAKLGLKKFHDLLLQGGQIPFTLIERRIESQLCNRSS
jgi:hypothetical protein